MNHISFAEFLESAPCILGEGAVIERLRRNNDLELDPYLVNSAFIYEDAKRVALETICRQYLDIGREYGLLLLLSTPTWRASRERIAAGRLCRIRSERRQFQVSWCTAEELRRVWEEGCYLRLDELPRGCLQPC